MREDLQIADALSLRECSRDDYCGALTLLFRGISFILSSIVFHVIPTALEITMVCGILVCPLINRAPLADPA
jgi:ABC-type transport system involved in Fe-S cluster assembly fused permease/ATPase subunit